MSLSPRDKGQHLNAHSPQSPTLCSAATKSAGWGSKAGRSAYTNHRMQRHSQESCSAAQSSYSFLNSNTTAGPTALQCCSFRGRRSNMPLRGLLQLMHDPNGIPQHGSQRFDIKELTVAEMRHHGSSQCPTVLPPFSGDDDGNLVLVVCQGDGRHLVAAEQEEVDGPADVAAAHSTRWSDMPQGSWAAAFHQRQAAVKQRM